LFERLLKTRDKSMKWPT